MIAVTSATIQTAMAESNDDFAIIELAIADPRAFAPLYDRYANAIYGYCRRRLNDPDDAADATSLVFTNAIQGLPRFWKHRKRPGASVRSWLFSIAHTVM